MKMLSEIKLKLIKKELSATTRALENLNFNEIHSLELDDFKFRQRDFSIADFLSILIGKAESCQKNALSTIINQLAMEGCLQKNFSRGTLFYRSEQIDCKKFLDKLLIILNPLPSTGYIKCTFDGSCIALPSGIGIEEKFSKINLKNNKQSSKPIAKLMYLMTDDSQACVSMSIETYKYSERVGMIAQAIEAKEKGLKLDIMADRGLYGAMPCKILDDLGHRYSIRLGGELVKKLKDYKFKKDSLVLDLNIYRSSIKPYKELVPDLKEGIFQARIVRKKGTTTKKAMYIITNDYGLKAAEFFARYYKRQRIEDTFKYLKSYGGLEEIHFNTGIKMVELTIISLIFYLSLMQKVLSKIIKTPRPDEKGKETPNRHLSWHLFFIVIKSGYKNLVLNQFLSEVLKNKLKIRPGRKHTRLQTYTTKRKIA